MLSGPVLPLFRLGGLRLCGLTPPLQIVSGFLYAIYVCVYFLTYILHLPFSMLTA